MSESTADVHRKDRLSQWVREHYSAVRGYLIALTCCADTADDLAQEVFRRAASSQEGYEERGHARAYLIRVADRLVCDRARKAGREVKGDDEFWRRIEPVSAEPEPTAGVTRQETQQQLAAALDTLSPPQRRVLMLRYYGNFGFAEISETMNCPLNTVLSHCRRGLLAMRKLLVDNP